MVAREGGQASRVYVRAIDRYLVLSHMVLPDANKRQGLEKEARKYLLSVVRGVCKQSVVTCAILLKFICCHGSEHQSVFKSPPAEFEVMWNNSIGSEKQKRTLVLFIHLS